MEKTVLKPELVFHYFNEICQVPRPSKKEEKMIAYLKAFGAKHNLETKVDEAGNVLIKKPATPGKENLQTVVLQSHIDMVCEKNNDVQHDFLTDPIETEIDGEWLKAKGTTLGADNGIGVATELAILADDSIEHGPLECLFTVDEEIGMLGAAALDMSPLKARTMLNMDSEDEGYLLVSCAGGLTAKAHLPVKRDSVTDVSYMQLTVNGLLGGPSGVEIDKGRANANIMLGRALYELAQDCEYKIVSIEGGKKDNAIPREAHAVLAVKNGDVAAASAKVKALQEIYRKEYCHTDAEITVTIDRASQDITCDPMDRETTERIVTALMNLPNGIQNMSFAVEGLVQTSLNLGIMMTDAQEVCLSYSVRSSVETQKEYLVEQISCLVKRLGGTVTCIGEYPAWEYREQSPLRDKMIEIFEKQYGRKPIVQALHAGVECGLFAGQLPGLDCVSFGPDMKDIHTPKETMDVGSVERTWNYVLEILRNL